MKKAVFAALCLSAAALPLTGASAQNATSSDTATAETVFQRNARGDITAPDGARRVTGDMSETYRQMAQHDAQAPVRNVILLIGDGMGDSEITIARNYAEGAGGYFKGIDALPVTGQYTHYSIDRETGRPVYVTDSAASATSFASGIKTYNGAIGVDIHGRPHDSVLTLARRAGLATGNVSTAALQDATPAAQIAHVSYRGCAGPEETARECPENALEQGGAGSIAEQLLATRADVTLGGGAAPFRQTARAGEWAGQTLLDQAAARGYHVVTSAAELAGVAAANDTRPLLGLFANGNMPVRWLGPKATHHGNIDLAPVTCTLNPDRKDDQPTLAALTSKAIELLSANPKGFFLQVEGASIDKQSHAYNPCGQIGETVDLDEAVQVALEFARRDGNTLVIVTADHAHAGQIIYADAAAPGLSAALRTLEGEVMAVSYGNSEGSSAGHTGTQLRVAAFGPRAFNVAGLLDQTDVFYIMRDALGLTQGAAPAAE